ncbi:MAG: cysteine desulfurase [Candidatus Micrarchaeota archaeon]
MFDAAEIRKDFPIFRRKANGKPLVYLDSAATSQKPGQVIGAMTRFHEECNANVHRGIYRLSEEATQEYESSRKKTAGLVGAKPQEIVFTRNATEGINLVAYSYGSLLKEGGTVLLTEMEHHSNIVPWQLLAARKKINLEFVPVDIGTGMLDMEAFSRMLGKKPALVAFTQASNVLGTISDARSMTAEAHDAGAAVLVDGAQGVPHIATDVGKIGCDFLAFSGHKMLGPSGIGALYATGEMLEKMPPFMAGGDMIREVSLQESTWNDVPYKFEAGTPNAVGAIGMGAAADYLKGIGFDVVREHEKKITEHALRGLGAIPEVSIFGPMHADNKTGVVAFNVKGVHAHDLASIADSEGIAIRAGHHCAQPLLNRFGVTATARASFYVYNTEEDVEALVLAVRKALEVFG